VEVTRPNCSRTDEKRQQEELHSNRELLFRGSEEQGKHLEHVVKMQMPFHHPFPQHTHPRLPESAFIKVCLFNPKFLQNLKFKNHYKDRLEVARGSVGGRGRWGGKWVKVVKRYTLHYKRSHRDVMYKW